MRGGIIMFFARLSFPLLSAVFYKYIFILYFHIYISAINVIIIIVNNVVNNHYVIVNTKHTL